MDGRFAIVSLGCAKNLVDSEVMADAMLKNGFAEAEPEQADVLIINTCAFIDPAKQEAIDTIFSATRARENGSVPAGQKIIVAGCLSQRYASELVDLMPEVDCFLGVDYVCKVADVAKSCLQGTSEKVYSTKVSTLVPDFGESRYRLTGKHFAYVKIAEGCNHACAYCVIPRIRGAHRSRPQANIVREVRYLVEQGVKGEENLELGRKYMETNGKRPEVITTPSGLQYEIITPGGTEKYDTAIHGDAPTAEVMYKGTLVDGTVFDQSKQPVKFNIRQVIPGFTEALKLMPVGAKWRVTIPANLAYGANGPGSIGPNSTLIFEMELLGLSK